METMRTNDEILTLATFDVFEKMFYLFLETVPVEGRQYDLATTLAFSGPMEGEIRLYLPEPLAQAMAENMLSLPQRDITAAMREDCAKEAVNMIGGQFLRTIDPSSVFHLSLPLCERNAAVIHHDDPGTEPDPWLSFESDMGKLTVTANLKGHGKRGC